jgi:hypothetical protein
MKSSFALHSLPAARERQTPKNKKQSMEPPMHAGKTRESVKALQRMLAIAVKASKRDQWRCSIGVHRRLIDPDLV